MIYMINWEHAWNKNESNIDHGQILSRQFDMINMWGRIGCNSYHGDMKTWCYECK